MALNQINIRIDIRSSLSFIIFSIIAVGFTIFILNKAEETIQEIDRLSEDRAVLFKEAGVADDLSALDTSNWKTYRNEKYGFEIRYPAELELFEYKPGAFLPLGSEGPIVLLYSHDPSSPDFSIFYFKERMKTHIEITFNNLEIYTNVTFSDQFIDGKPAKIVDYFLTCKDMMDSRGQLVISCDSGIKQREVYFETDEGILAILSDTQEYHPNFDKILSTFKFIK